MNYRHNQQDMYRFQWSSAFPPAFVEKALWVIAGITTIVGICGIQ